MRMFLLIFQDDRIKEIISWLSYDSTTHWLSCIDHMQRKLFPVTSGTKVTAVGRVSLWVKEKNVSETTTSHLFSVLTDNNRKSCPNKIYNSILQYRTRIRPPTLSNTAKHHCKEIKIKIRGERKGKSSTRDVSRVWADKAPGENAKRLHIFTLIPSGTDEKSFSPFHQRNL